MCRASEAVAVSVAAYLTHRGCHLWRKCRAWEAEDSRHTAADRIQHQQLNRGEEGRTDIRQEAQQNTADSKVRAGRATAGTDTVQWDRAGRMWCGYCACWAAWAEGNSASWLDTAAAVVGVVVVGRGG